MLSPGETYVFLSLKRLFRIEIYKKDYILLDVRAIFPIFATD